MADPRDIATYKTARSVFRKCKKICETSVSTPAEKAELLKMCAEYKAGLEQLAQHIGLKPNVEV